MATTSPTVTSPGLTNPQILIVGAGAQGIVTGYHLSLAGASVTYLVREPRRAALDSPQRLYCFDDGFVKTFKDYAVVSGVSEIADRVFDYVLVTLDGPSCRSPEGALLMGALGDLARNHHTIIIAGGVGVREYFVATTRLPPARILEGTLGCLAYQTDRVTLPVHSPTDPRRLAESSIAYHHFSNQAGFMLSAQPRDTAQRFADLHGRSGVSKCLVMNPSAFAIISTAFFPVTAMCDLAGWPNAVEMSKNTELMALGSSAMREVIGLPEHKWLGRVAALFVSKTTLSMLLKKMEKDSLPLDFHAFNRFHHGGKVRAQDIQVMKDCVASGASKGIRLSALQRLITRYEQHCAR